MRRRLGTARAQVAARMGITQGPVSAIEHAKPGTTELRTLAPVEAHGGRLEIIAELLERAGRSADAGRWLREAARQGEYSAVEEWQSAVRAGERHATDHLVELLDRVGRSAEAAQWLATAAGKGDSKAMLNLSTRLARDGDEGQSDQWLKRAVDAKNLRAIGLLTGKLEEEGRHEEAARIRLSAARWVGRWGGYHELYAGIRMLRKAGKTEEAETRLRHALETHRRGPKSG